MKYAGRIAMSLVLCVVTTSLAQINLKYFNSRSVRTNEYANTRVESLLVDTEVGRGQAKTTLTMVLTPGMYVPYHYEETDSMICYDQTVYSAGGDPDIREYCYPYQELVWEEPKAIDSVEITASLHLPADFVASEMYLWVEGEPQRAYIQDRNLAWEQYSDIVGVRRDPALLETWGNGSYNLRIFPAQSHHSRKISITFNHTLDDDTLDMIAARIPLRFDSADVSYNEAEMQRHSIGYVRATFRSTDGNQYEASLAGLGGGEFNDAALEIQRRDVDFLGEAVVTASDPSGGDEFFWQGTDTDNVRTAGFETMLAESTVELENEPETRIFVLDVRQEVWDANEYNKKFNDYYYQDYPKEVNYDRSSSAEVINIWNRARKLAVLCIDNYVKDGQTFNLIINGEEPVAVFDQPVSLRDGRATAIEAILAAKVDANAGAMAAVEAGLTAAGDEGIMVLISDIYTPYNASHLVFDDANNYQGLETSPAGERYQELLGQIDTAITQSGVIFYAFADEWRLSSIAQKTGGFKLGGLRHNHYLKFETYTADGDRYYRPVMPGLFSDNYQGLVISEVVSDDFEDIAYTTDQYYYWRWRGPVPFMEGDIAMRKERAGLAKSSMIWPGYYPKQTTLRFSGALARQSGSQNVAVTVKGHLGGLAFTKTLRGRIGQFDQNAASVQHAFRTSEYLATQDWRANEGAIKSLGLDHHIVTRQTSLLALEPGDTPYPDTAASPGDQSDGRSEATLSSDWSASDSKAAPGQQQSGETVSLDSMSLEDLVMQTTAIAPASPVKATPARIEVRVSGNRLLINLPVRRQAETVEVALFDLRGREVAHTTFKGADAAKGSIEWNPGVQRFGLGHHVVRVKAAGVERAFKVLFAR